MKTFINIAFASFLFFSISCKKEMIQIQSFSAGNDNANRQTAHYIGEAFGGGIIFFIDSTGERGLIAATNDIGFTVWSTNGYFQTGASGVGMKAGPRNTRRFISTTGSGNYAAKLCGKYEGEGFTDWFLPSKDELHQMFLHRDLIGTFADGVYWSSSEDTLNYLQFAWGETFTGADQIETWWETINGYVRPVRAF